MNTADSLVHELGLSTGLSLSISEGATILTGQDGHEYWIESTEGSELIIMHTSIGDDISSSSTLEETLRLLALNTKVELMKGAWLGIHPGTKTLRLCVAAPIDFVDANILVTLLGNLLELASTIPHHARLQ